MVPLTSVAWNVSSHGQDIPCRWCWLPKPSLNEACLKQNHKSEQASSLSVYPSSGAATIGRWQGRGTAVQQLRCDLCARTKMFFVQKSRLRFATLSLASLPTIVNATGVSCSLFLNQFCRSSFASNHSQCHPVSLFAVPITAVAAAPSLNHLQRHAHLFVRFSYRCCCCGSDG